VVAYTYKYYTTAVSRQITELRPSFAVTEWC